MATIIKQGDIELLKSNQEALFSVVKSQGELLSRMSENIRALSQNQASQNKDLKEIEENVEVLNRAIESIEKIINITTV